MDAAFFIGLIVLAILELSKLGSEQPEAPVVEPTVQEQMK